MQINTFVDMLLHINTGNLVLVCTATQGRVGAQPQGSWLEAPPPPGLAALYIVCHLYVVLLLLVGGGGAQLVIIYRATQMKTTKN